MSDLTLSGVGAMSDDQIKEMLAEGGVTDLDSLIEMMKKVAANDKQSGGIGKVTPMASWIVKVIRID